MVYPQTTNVHLNHLNGSFLEMQMEKRSIRRVGNLVGLAWFIPNIAVQLLLIIYQVVGVYINARGDSTLLALLSDPMFGLVLQLGLSVIIFIPSYAIVAGRLAPKKPDARPVIEFGKFKPGLGAAVILIGYGTFMLGNMATNILSQILTNFTGYTPHQGSLDLPDGIYGAVFYLIVSSVVPALVEEFAMRGAVMGTLRPYSQPFAIVASSVIFGVMHGNMIQAPFAFVGGLAIGYAAIVTRSIWPAVITHFLINFTATIYDFLPETVYNVYSVVHVMAMLFSLVIGVLLLLKYKPRPFDIKGSDSLGGTQRAVAFFTAPAMIVALVFVLFESLLTAALTGFLMQ